MILTEKVNIFISNKIIGYYRKLGYSIIPNSVNCINTVDLMKNSSARIDVRCDICGNEKNISYQKYNKNVRKYNIYTCNSSCAMFKNRLTLKEIYGQENFNRSEENKLKIKEKYDKITKEIEDRGYINCIKCNNDRGLSEYLVKNERYMHICKSCRDIDRKIRTLKRIEDKRQKDRDYYKKNLHIHAWRQVLKNYLNRKTLSKIDKTFNLLRYTPDDLKSHLEGKFYDDLSWENYGKKWQIDHIVHVSLFKDDTPFHIANSLDNLRPLERINNISRGNKMDEDCINMMMRYKEYIKEYYINKLSETYSEKKI